MGVSIAVVFCDRGSKTHRGVSPACVRVVGILMEESEGSITVKGVSVVGRPFSRPLHTTGGCAIRSLVLQSRARRCGESVNKVSFLIGQERGTGLDWTKSHYEIKMMEDWTKSHGEMKMMEHLTT